MYTTGTFYFIAGVFQRELSKFCEFCNGCLGNTYYLIYWSLVAIIAILNDVNIAELTLLAKYKSGQCKRESMASAGGKTLEG